MGIEFGDLVDQPQAAAGDGRCALMCRRPLEPLAETGQGVALNEGVQSGGIEGTARGFAHARDIEPRVGIGCVLFGGPPARRRNSPVLHR